MKLSIIIPTYNRQREMLELVDKLSNQGNDNEIEIIIVDDHSKKVNKKIPKTQYIRYFYLDKNRGPSYARNFGIEKSKGEIIAFLDDDHIVADDYISSVIAEHDSNKHVRALNGQTRKLKETKYLNLWHMFYSDTFDNGYGLHTVNMVSPGLFSIKRELLGDKELFDVNLRAREDFDLYLRLKDKGITIYKTNKIIAYNRGRGTLLALIKQYAGYGRGEYWLRQKYTLDRIKEELKIAEHSTGSFRFLRWMVRQAAEYGYLTEKNLHERNGKSFATIYMMLKPRLKKFRLKTAIFMKKVLSPKYWVYFIDKKMFNSHFWRLKNER